MTTLSDQHLARNGSLSAAGLAAVAVPHEPGGTTSITVTHYGAELGSPDYTQRDRFVMRKSGPMTSRPAGVAGPDVMIR